MTRSPIPADLAAVASEPRVTEKQESFLRSLANERDIAEEHRAEIIRRLDAGEVTKRRASDWISRLLDKPKRAKAMTPGSLASSATPEFPSPEVVPAGRYAVNNEDGELRFYRVARGSQNPNRVWIHVQHGPDESELPFNLRTYETILHKIAEDPQGASLRYGRELRHCGVCGRRLTNRLSRELGIGPICGGRMFGGEEFADLKGVARDSLLAAGLDPDEEIEEEEI